MDDVSIIGGMSSAIPWETILPLAEEIGIETKDARRKWRERGSVPAKWRWPIVEHAISRGIPLSMKDFERAAA